MQNSAMSSMVTKVTDRGQTSIPAALRRRLRLEDGSRIVWQMVSERECRITVLPDRAVEGPAAMLGYARSFRPTRSTAEWMRALREGESD